MSKFKVGLVGLGRAGWNMHAAQLRGHKDFEIVAVVDPSEERRAEASGALGARTYARLSAMLEAEDLDLAVVATPTANHEEEAIRILEAGMACVLEKPMASDWRGACRVAETTQRTGGRLFLHHQHLFLPDYRFLRETISSGILGEVFELRMNWARYTRRDDWQTLRKNSGGLLRNYGSHALAIVLALFDSPVKKLMSALRQVKDPGDCEDHVHLFLEMEDGRLADIFLSTSCALPLPRFMLIGSAGAALSEGEKEARLKFCDPSALAGLQPRDGAAEGRRYVVDEKIPWEERVVSLVPAAGCPGFYDNVAAVLRGEEEMVVAPASGLEVARAIDWADGGEDPAQGIPFPASVALA